MKLYTKLQVEEIYLQGWYDGKIGFKDRIDDAISYQTPIELPSDEEIEKVVEQEYKRRDNNEFLYGRSDELKLAYKAGVWDGVKWIKEQILNQNK